MGIVDVFSINVNQNASGDSTPKLPRGTAQIFFPERRYGFIDSNGLAPWQNFHCFSLKVFLIGIVMAMIYHKSQEMEKKNYR